MGHPLQHLDKQAGQRQIRPACVGIDVKQHHQPLAARLGGHQRRAIVKTGPDLGGQTGLRLCQNLPRYCDILRHIQAGKRRSGLKGLKFFGHIPGERAAKGALSAPQPHRQKRVSVAGKMRTGKAQQHPATGNKSVQFFGLHG